MLSLTFNCELQESIKSKHPQLLYESKLYKILQGGSECCLCCCKEPASAVLEHTLVVMFLQLAFPTFGGMELRGTTM